MTSLSKPVRDFDERRERVKQREHGADQRKERAAFRIQAQARGTATRERVKSPHSPPSPPFPPSPPSPPSHFSPPSPPCPPSLRHGADERQERAAIRIQAQARGNATRKRVKTLRRQWLDGIGRVQVRWSFCMSTLSEFNILLARKLRIMLQQ